MGNVNKDYKLIPMSEITDEAREIAVRWGENMKDDFITQKHKLASDIMNYAREDLKEKLNPMIEKWEKELDIWKRTYNENALFNTKEQRQKAIHFAAAITSMLKDLKTLAGTDTEN